MLVKIYDKRESYTHSKMNLHWHFNSWHAYLLYILFHVLSSWNFQYLKCFSRLDNFLSSSYEWLCANRVFHGKIRFWKFHDNTTLKRKTPNFNGNGLKFCLNFFILSKIETLSLIGGTNPIFMTWHLFFLSALRLNYILELYLR